MTISIDLRQYPGWLLDKVDQFPFAASQALNDTAFGLKRDLDTRGPGDLTFRRAHRPALGVRFDRSTKRNLEATVWSDRKWLGHQVDEGAARPVRGIVHEGRRYLLIPSPGRRKNRQGRFVGLRRGSTFVVQSGRNLVMLSRQSRSRVETVGILVREADYADDYKWDEQAERTVDRVMADNFGKRLHRAMNSRR